VEPGIFLKGKRPELKCGAGSTDRSQRKEMSAGQRAV